MSSDVDSPHEVPAVSSAGAADLGVEVVQGELVDATSAHEGQLQLDSYLTGYGPADLERRQELRHLAKRALELYDNSKAPGTLTAYGSAWRLVLSWCQEFELVDDWWQPGPASGDGALVAAMPVEVLAVYLAWLVDHKYAYSTIAKHCDAVRHFHLNVGLNPPTLDPRISRLRAGIKREVGTRTQGKTALQLPDIALLYAAIDRLPGHRLKKLRAKAMLLLYFWSGARRSELNGLMLSSFALERNGLIISLSRSKTNQDGAREEIGVLRRTDELCPVRALTDRAAHPMVRKGSGSALATTRATGSRSRTVHHRDGLRCAVPIAAAPGPTAGQLEARRRPLNPDRTRKPDPRRGPPRSRAAAEDRLRGVLRLRRRSPPGRVPDRQPTRRLARVTIDDSANYANRVKFTTTFRLLSGAPW